MLQQKCLFLQRITIKAVEIAVATANSTTVGDPNGEFRLGPIANKVQYEKNYKNDRNRYRRGCNISSWRF